MGTQYLKPWLLAAVVAVFALAAGYVLPRPSRSGDMLDAVAAVQRHSPRFLVSEPMPPANWTKSGALFLCRTSRTAEELDGLISIPHMPILDGPESSALRRQSTPTSTTSLGLRTIQATGGWTTASLSSSAMRICCRRCEPFLPTLAFAWRLAIKTSWQQLSACVAGSKQNGPAFAGPN